MNGTTSSDRQEEQAQSSGARCCPRYCGPDPSHDSLFRSEEMSLCQLLLQSESAYQVISELGELGLVQFKDCNQELTAYQRKYVSEVRMCDNMERILRFIDGEIRKEKIIPRDNNEVPGAPPPRELRDILADLEKMETDLRDINVSRDQLSSNLSELTELQFVLNASHYFLDELGGDTRLGAVTQGDVNAGFSGQIDLEMEAPAERSMRLNFITGTIPSEKLMGFERMLWFACRGNVYLRTTEIKEAFDDTKTGEIVRKSVFFLFFQGERLKAKSQKICEGFRCNTYTIPKTQAERVEMSTGLAQRITDTRVVLGKTEDHRRMILTDAGQNINTLSIKVLKTKAIYHTLNCFNMDVTQKLLIAELWCPTRDLRRIDDAIQRGTVKSNSDVPSVLNIIPANEVIPTFNRVNKFTSAFQSIMNAYGISRYREINPALFATVTFPFIFAIMFGDFGHGLIMFGFALWMVLKEDKMAKSAKGNEIFKIIFGGRYIILLMGIFSVYTGWIYNDFFSKSVNLFNSSWRVNFDARNQTAEEIDWSHDYHDGLKLAPDTDFSGTPHPFGLDPVWMLAINKITYVNSYKMKLSILIGIIQMMFGLALSLVNNLFFSNWINIFCQFIPELLFFSSIFGYMFIMIVAKFLIRFNNPGCAPSVLVTFINMFLFGGLPPPDDCLSDSAFILYKNQEQMDLVQTILVVTAGLCIPWLLVTKPLAIFITRKIEALRDQPGTGPVVLKSKRVEGTIDGQAGTESFSRLDSVQHSVDEEHGHDEASGEPGEESMGEIIVHQCIHTIEYSLGCVSNTASYLRLWALSLAHGQLSEVLWNMVLQIGLSSSNNFAGAGLLVIVFPPFAILTVAVLLLMEGLSAFLHALRLHWVEFNGKFYAGDGIKFSPFSFKHAVEANLTSDK